MPDTVGLAANSRWKSASWLVALNDDAFETELLFEIWHRWQPYKDVHYIWNISTKLCEENKDIEIDGLTMRESMEYRNQKMALELAHHQLNAQPSNIKMSLIRPGSVRTHEHSPAQSIEPDKYVRQVLAQQGQL